MTSEITLTLGAFTVELGTVEVDEDYTNRIIAINPPQSPQKQAEGPKPTRVINLLRVTHQLLIRGEITPTASKSADDVKSDLINIFKGGGVVGTPIVVTYDSHPDSPLNMFMEKLAIKEKAIDYDPASGEAGLAKYTVQITLLEGVSI